MEQRLTLPRLALCAAAAAVGLTFFGISATISYRYGHMLADNAFDASTLGTLGVAVSALKVLLPFVLAAAAASRRWTTFVVAAVVLALCSSYSLAASYNLTAAGRAPAVTEAITQREIEVHLARLGTPRPASVVEPLIAAAKDSDTKAKLRSEMAAAKEQDRLRGQRAPPPRSEAGVSEISALLDIPGGTVRAALLIVIALCLELGEIAGLWFAATIVAPRRTLSRPVAVSEPPPAAREREDDAAIPAELPATPPAVPTPTPSTRQTALHAWLRRWLAQRSDKAILVDTVLEAYTEECRLKKRKKPARTAVGKALSKVATEYGLTSAMGGRAYRRSAAA